MTTDVKRWAGLAQNDNTRPTSTPEGSAINAAWKAAQAKRKEERFANPPKKGDPTSLNLSTLKTAFGGKERISNRVEPTSAAGIRRCLAAGLVAVEGKELVLTAAGKAAIG